MSGLPGGARGFYRALGGGGSISPDHSTFDSVAAVVVLAQFFRLEGGGGGGWLGGGPGVRYGGGDRLGGGDCVVRFFRGHGPALMGGRDLEPRHWFEVVDGGALGTHLQGGSRLLRPPGLRRGGRHGTLRWGGRGSEGSGGAGTGRLGCRVILTIPIFVHGLQFWNEPINIFVTIINQILFYDFKGKPKVRVYNYTG